MIDLLGRNHNSLQLFLKYLSEIRCWAGQGDCNVWKAMSQNRAWCGKEAFTSLGDVPEKITVAQGNKVHGGVL